MLFCLAIELVNLQSDSRIVYPYLYILYDISNCGYFLSQIFLHQRCCINFFAIPFCLWILCCGFKRQKGPKGINDSCGAYGLFKRIGNQFYKLTTKVSKITFISTLTEQIVSCVTVYLAVTMSVVFRLEEERLKDQRLDGSKINERKEAIDNV